MTQAEWLFQKMMVKDSIFDMMKFSCPSDHDMKDLHPCQTHGEMPEPNGRCFECWMQECEDEK